ncbi:putative n2,n2-dimethylguanosine trna methyltransferase, partial [Globisporangium splendens]
MMVKFVHDVGKRDACFAARMDVMHHGGSSSDSNHTGGEPLSTLLLCAHHHRLWPRCHLPVLAAWESTHCALLAPDRSSPIRVDEHDLGAVGAELYQVGLRRADGLILLDLVLLLAGRRQPPERLDALLAAQQLCHRFFDYNGQNKNTGHVHAASTVATTAPQTLLTTWTRSVTRWDGSVVLAKYLEHARAGDIRGARIVEVGAGTGLVGLSVALLGAKHVVLTDLEYTMENLKRNVAETMANVGRGGDDEGTDAATEAIGEVATQVLD